MPLLALRHSDGNGIGGYGISHPDRLATIDGLYFLDHPRRAPQDYLDALGSMFGEFLIVENNRTQERGLVARIEVPDGSRQYLRPHQAAGGWPTEPKMAGILGDGPEVVLRVQWVPGNEAWGVAKHGRAGGSMVDRVALGAALGRYPEAGKFLRDFFWTAAPRNYEENRRLYRERLDALTRADRYVRDNRGGLVEAFADVLAPLGEPPR